VAGVIRDSMDFSAYMRATEAAVKVRKASEFADELADEFSPKEGQRQGHMFSTKLRHDMDFRPGEVTCWAGYNGHRKSMFVGQLALDLCVQNRRTLQASFEMRPAQTLARMARQAHASSVIARDSLASFGRWTDGRLWLFDHMGRISPELCIAVSNYFAAELKGEHVFIDSMMMVCGSEESMDEQKQFMTDLVRLAQETGLHVHLVTHCRKPQAGEDKPPTKYDLRGSAAISDQAHNVITVWSNKAKKAKAEVNAPDTPWDDPDALVTVEKQRNGRWEGRVKLWFHDDSLRFTDSRMEPIDPYALRTE
jgi:twinkle protein